MGTMFQMPRAKRMEGRGVLGQTKTGKLNPVMAIPVQGSEFGMIKQSITIELDPIMGRLLTPIYARLTSVFVPTQDMHALKFAGANTAGVTEMVRQELLTGAVMFDLEPENEITKRCEVIGGRIAGVAKVNEDVRLAHNCAVNFLRRRLYDKAAQITKNNFAVTPALLSSTALQRMRGVLDPDDHINGKVPLNIANMKLPIEGLGAQTGAARGGAATVQETGEATTTAFPNAQFVNQAGSSLVYKQTATGTVAPDIWADFTGGNATMSLPQLYAAQKMDELTGIFRGMIEADPVNGEKNILRLVYGMQLDDDRNPFVLAEREVQIAGNVVNAMDTAGVTNETRRSDVIGKIEFAVPVPRTELGGIVITFLEVKPDETIAAQPHPIFTKPFTATNYAAQELDLDPVPVTMRQLSYSVAVGDETTVAMYTGAREVERVYSHYGISRMLDGSTLTGKSVMWNYAIPLSVTPTNILYPDAFAQPIFAFPNSEVVTYYLESDYSFETPTIFGPSPVETITALATYDLFDEV